MDGCSTAKREEGRESPASRASFRTPPKRTTKPSLEQLERWERMERDTNRRC
jgi:hypothetical protein